MKQKLANKFAEVERLLSPAQDAINNLLFEWPDDYLPMLRKDFLDLESDIDQAIDDAKRQSEG